MSWWRAGSSWVRVPAPKVNAKRDLGDTLIAALATTAGAMDAFTAVQDYRIGWWPVAAVFCVAAAACAVIAGNFLVRSSLGHFPLRGTGS